MQNMAEHKLSTIFANRIKRRTVQNRTEYAQYGAGCLNTLYGIKKDNNTTWNNAAVTACYYSVVFILIYFYTALRLYISGLCFNTLKLVHIFS